MLLPTNKNKNFNFIVSVSRTNSLQNLRFNSDLKRSTFEGLIFLQILDKFEI